MANWYVVPAGAGATDGNDTNSGSSETLVAATAVSIEDVGATLVLASGTWAALGVTVGMKVVVHEDLVLGNYELMIIGSIDGAEASLTEPLSSEYTTPIARVGGPFATIGQAAFAVAAAGSDTIYIKPGTYDTQVVVTGAVFPAEANVEIAETAYGPTGAEYAGKLDLAAEEAAAAAAQLVTDKAAVDAEKANIKTGTTILTKAGSYPTTETSKAAQLADDKNIVLAAAADIRDGATILDQEGTLDLPAVADVRDTVEFDGGTKTGIYDPTAAAVFPDVSDVWYGSGLYGPSGEDLTPTKRASSIVNCEEENIAAGVTIDDVTGTFTTEIASQKICDAIRDLKSGLAAVRL